MSLFFSFSGSPRYLPMECKAQLLRQNALGLRSHCGSTLKVWSGFYCVDGLAKVALSTLVEDQGGLLEKKQ